jgi:hypothetical protein
MRSRAAAQWRLPSSTTVGNERSCASMPKDDADRATPHSLLGIIRPRVGVLPWGELPNEKSIMTTALEANMRTVMTGVAMSPVIDMINGRWCSQILYAGVELGVFEHLSDNAARNAESIARELHANPALLYRLLRALSSINLLREDSDGRFSLTEGGRLLRSDHPQSLRAMALLEEGPVHYANWRHLPAMIRSGVQDGFRHEFGMTMFEYLSKDSRYAATFHSAMVSYSAAEASAIREEMGDKLTEPAVFCDIGGGHGYLLAELLKDRPKASGIVFDLPLVTAEEDLHVTRQERLRGRCMHLAGDMFVRVPEAEVYLLKHILHDWNDEECQQILSVVRKAAKPTSRLLICEWIVPDSDESHFSKIVDIAMLCISSGRQRTADEFTKLLSSTGWAIESMRQLKGSPLAMLKAAAK